jgi:hypothetical protein
MKKPEAWPPLRVDSIFCMGRHFCDMDSQPEAAVQDSQVKASSKSLVSESSIVKA